jgi:hypothetical protein
MTGTEIAMEPVAHALLAPWQSFYVIVGSVAGALIGLQFVVVALVADSRRRTTSPEIAAFGTPTVLHLCGALFLSAMLTVPWTATEALRTLLFATGIAGLLYGIVVVRRASKSHQYKPQLEDWIWHGVLPLVANGTLAAAAIFFTQSSARALGMLAGVTLGLVFIGIHNAWDTIIYIATQADRDASAAEAPRRTGRKRQR